MAILEVNNVSIRYMKGDFKEIGLKEYILRNLKGNYHVSEFWADKDISFTLEKGEMLGIIGSNGAGKSTLLKTLSGIMEPSAGSVHREGSIAALLELGSGFDGDLTVRENTYLRGAMMGYTRKFMDDTYDWYGRNPLMSNDTTYGQINNNFTAGVVGSAYKITNPKYIAANAYSAAAHPLQTLDRININGQDALNGVMGIVDKVRNKEYGALARGAGYAAGSVAQVYLLGKGIEKCGDLIDERKYRLNSVNSGSVSASKIGNTNQVEQNFTREDIISSLDGVTDKSTEIANALKNKEIGLNVLGDELIERYYGYDLDTVAFQEGKQIYVRSSSSSLISDVVHEGTHAIDFSQDISQKIISSRAGEYKAYSAERLFQIEAGMPVDFMSEDDMLVHIWSNY